jgi:hypothetical protein
LSPNFPFFCSLTNTCIRKDEICGDLCFDGSPGSFWYDHWYNRNKDISVHKGDWMKKDNAWELEEDVYDKMGTKCHNTYCHNLHIPKWLERYNYNGECYVPSLGFIDDTFATSRCGVQSVQMNALINTFIESKKLYFNTAKCYLIHIGPKKEQCCPLKVHDKIMNQKTSEKYLGDVVSSTGNTENIEDRAKSGRKSISDILSMLKEIGIGGNYIRIALIFRESTLKSKLLLNSDVWHNLIQKEIDLLEDVDKSYLRIILNSHSKVALECILFEVGLRPLKYDVMRKRLMYLWKVLHVDKSELIFRIYRSQKNAPNAGDWVKLVENDKKVLDLDISDEEIEKISKNKFKKIVETKIDKYALQQLNALKSKHSKSQYLQSSSFKTAGYLIDERFSKSEAQLLFRLRSKTLNVKQNFENLCQTCRLFPETQSHLLQCPEIAPKLKLLNLQENDAEEKFIYGNIDQQLIIVNIYSKSGN